MMAFDGYDWHETSTRSDSRKIERPVFSLILRGLKSSQRIGILKLNSK